MAYTAAAPSPSSLSSVKPESKASPFSAEALMAAAGQQAAVAAGGGASHQAVKPPKPPPPSVPLASPSPQDFYGSQPSPPPKKVLFPHPNHLIVRLTTGSFCALFRKLRSQKTQIPCSDVLSSVFVAFSAPFIG